MNRCNVCPRQCNAIRTEKENIAGFCSMPSSVYAAYAGLHFWEEPCISGTRGSGTVFFSGCSLGCVFCQNEKISKAKHGKMISDKRLSEIFAELENSGAHNINLVTPTHYFDNIVNALNIYRPKIPIVYNCGGYEFAENIQNDIFDIYLFDLKYISTDNSLKYSKTPDYFKFASSAIKTACKIKGKPKYTEDSVMTSGVIIRHLLLPNSTNEAIKIIDWAAENCPDAVFSLMSQYIPFNTEKFPEINRRVTQREYDKVANYLMTKKFSACYIQELTSSKAEYIPNFDLSGI